MSEPRNVNIRNRHFSILIAVFNKKRRTKELTSNFEKNLAEILSRPCLTHTPAVPLTPNTVPLACINIYIYLT